MEQILLFLQPLLEIYGGSQGWLVSFVSILGSLRFFIKPIMSLLLTYVTFTKTKEDDIKLSKFENGKVIKMLQYFLDWMASIKFKK